MPWSKVSLCVTTIEPVLQSPGATPTEARMPQSLCSTIREVTAMRSLRTTKESSPRLPQLEKSPHSKEDPVQLNKQYAKSKTKNNMDCKDQIINKNQFSRSVLSDSATPWAAARQASLSITNSQSLLKLMSIESVMPSSHLILCHSLLLLPSIFPNIRVFSQLYTL